MIYIYKLRRTPDTQMSNHVYRTERKHYKGYYEGPVLGGESKLETRAILYLGIRRKLGVLSEPSVLISSFWGADAGVMGTLVIGVPVPFLDSASVSEPLCCFTFVGSGEGVYGVSNLLRSFILGGGVSVPFPDGTLGDGVGVSFIDATRSSDDRLV